MALVSRVGDIGIGTCSAHESTKTAVVTIQTGAPTVPVEGQAAATAASVGISSCGHTAVVATFSATVPAEGSGVHRQGDTGTLPGGSYTMQTAAATVDAGG